METVPTRMCQLAVGLPDVVVLGVDACAGAHRWWRRWNVRGGLAGVGFDQDLWTGRTSAEIDPYPRTGSRIVRAAGPGAGSSSHRWCA